MHAQKNDSHAPGGAAAPRSAGPSRQDAGADVKLQFRRARLDTVLDHLNDRAGVFIHANWNVPTEHTIDLWQDEPVSAAEALSLLRRVLVDMGCTLIRKGALFSIIRSQDVKKHYVPLPAV